MEIENIRRGLECLTQMTSCVGCPYWNSGRTREDCLLHIGKDTLALLKEHEAVEPYVAGNGESFETAETWWYECGNCNKPIDPNDKFCRHCGRSVK